MVSEKQNHPVLAYLKLRYVIHSDTLTGRGDGGGYTVRPLLDV